MNEKGPGKTGALILLATLNRGQLKIKLPLVYTLMLHTEKNHYL